MGGPAIRVRREISKSLGRAPWGRGSLSCLLTDGREQRDRRSGQLSEGARRGTGSLRNWRKRGGSLGGWGNRSQMTQGLGGPWEANSGDIKQWGASEGCPAWEYMLISMFHKTLPSSRKIDWNKARDGVGSQVFYLYGFLSGFSSSFIASHHCM